MIFAGEVIDLLSNPAFEGRGWKMAHVVNHVARGRPASKQQRERYRKGVRRVMDALIELNKVHAVPGRHGRSPVLYYWKVGHDVSDKLPAKCDNPARAIAPNEFMSCSPAVPAWLSPLSPPPPPSADLPA